jgi:VIT1/CCC1 family predicted Fe2+/Mn2+ transporter
MRAVQSAADDDEALAAIEDAYDDALTAVTSEEERERLYRQILDRARKAEPPRTRTRKDDLLGALGVFCLVVLTTVPAVVPFLLIPNRLVALRVSNALLVGLLFLVGYWGGRLTNANPWRASLTMLLVGVAVVAVAAALGG